MADILNTNLKSLEGMILDEEKLVTYLSLSKELCIHVNESKTILSQALQNLRQKNPRVNLNVNYVLSGIINENIAKTVVCTESELEGLKKEFKVIFFHHIYSINKGHPRVDYASLLTTNKIEDLILCPGIIKNTNCVKHTANEIRILKSNSQDIVTLQVEKVTCNTQKKIKKELIEKRVNESENSTKDFKVSGTESVKNIEVESTSCKIDEKGKLKENNVNIRQKVIEGFFKKTNGNSNKKGSVKEVMKKENIFEKSAEKVIVEIKNSVKIKDVIDDAENVSNKVVKKDIAEKVNKTQTFNKKNLKVDKKRKRVLYSPDTDSDNDTNDNDPFVVEEQSNLQNESEDEIPPTPTINTVKITSGILNPKKKRKIVNKTFIGDDGYYVTRKEEIYESCSENDEEVASKEDIPTLSKIKAEITPMKNKNEMKNSKKRVSPPQIGKQPTLMKYFKKK